MHLKTHLLLSFFLLVFSAPFRKYSEHFKCSEDGSNIIIDPSKPIKIGDREFYWLGSYEPTFGLPVVCSISSSSDEWMFEKVFFENGSPATGMQFGCKHGQFCSGIECVSFDLGGEFKWFGIIFVTCCLLALIWAFVPRSRTVPTAFVLLQPLRDWIDEDEVKEDKQPPVTEQPDDDFSDGSIY